MAAKTKTKKPVKRTTTATGHHANLCFDCQKAINGCEWARNFRPVPGWNAELIYLGNGVTYHITECPKFIRDDKRPVSNAALLEEDEESFFRDPVAYINAHSNEFTYKRRRKNKEEIA